MPPSAHTSGFTGDRRKQTLSSVCAKSSFHSLALWILLSAEQLDLATLMQAQDAEIDRRVAAGLDFRYGASMMQLVTCQLLPLTMMPRGLPAARIAW